MDVNITINEKMIEDLKNTTKKNAGLEILKFAMIMVFESILNAHKIMEAKNGNKN